MIFKRRRFLSVGVTCVSLLALNRAAFAIKCASTQNMPEGEFCLSDGISSYSTPCPPGCYCPGGSSVKVVFPNNGTASSISNDKQIYDWCKQGTKCLESSGHNRCGNSNTAKVWRCPSDFSNSVTGAKKIEDCYAIIPDNGAKLYYQQIKCDAGKYLPRGWSRCTSCDLDSRYYCPGGYFIPSVSKSVGLKECPSGKVANSAKTTCITSTASSQSGSAKCKAGQYLPSGSKQCVSCANLDSRYYCPGGQTFSVASYDQGLKQCPVNKVADSLHTSCIVQNQPTVRCEAGKYLPATASVCTSCPGDSRYYCPGGVTFNIASFDQGLKTCAYGKEANNAKTACITVSAIEVPAGKYLPANKVSPATCKGTTNYCPGGQFDMESFDQGIFECPFNSRANSSKTACTITLSKVQMQFGASGTSTPYPRQCWHQTDDPAKYMSCVLANSVSRYYK